MTYVRKSLSDPSKSNLELESYWLNIRLDEFGKYKFKKIETNAIFLTIMRNPLQWSDFIHDS